MDFELNKTVTVGALKVLKDLAGKDSSLIVDLEEAELRIMLPHYSGSAQINIPMKVNNREVAIPSKTVEKVREERLLALSGQKIADLKNLCEAAKVTVEPMGDKVVKEDYIRCLLNAESAQIAASAAGTVENVPVNMKFAVNIHDFCGMIRAAKENEESVQIFGTKSTRHEDDTILQSIGIGSEFHNVPVAALEEEPDITVEKSTPFGDITPDTFAKLAAVKASPDEKRPHIRGIYFDGENGYALSTDARRLHSIKIKANGAKTKFLFDKGVSTTLGKYLKSNIQISVPKDEEAPTSIMATATLPNGGELTVVQETLPGGFPPYEDLIKIGDTHTEVVLDVESLRGMVDGALVVSDAQYCSSIFSFRKEGVQVEASHPEKGFFVSDLLAPVQPYRKDPLNIALNAKFIADALQIKGGTTQMFVLGEQKPVIIRNGDFSATIMPMRI